MIGKTIKRYRENLGISQTELAKKLCLRQSTVAMWETGRNKPGYEMLIRIADIFGVELTELLGGKVARIPILGRVQAGIPRTAVEDIIGYVDASEDMYEPNEFFALKIKGDSMEPRICEDDVVIVRRQSRVDNGDIAIVLVDDEATCKRFYQQKEGIQLVSFNLQYSPMFFSNERMRETRIEILGKVCELRAKL